METQLLGGAPEAELEAESWPPPGRTPWAAPAPHAHQPLWGLKQLPEKGAAERLDALEVDAIRFDS